MDSIKEETANRRRMECIENEEAVNRIIQPWHQQITFRGLVASLLLGVIFSVIVMKLSLTTGLVHNLNVSTALLAFTCLSTWTKLLHKAGFITKPFTRQENTVIQTCDVACYTLSSAGGFGSFLFGLSKKTYEAATAGNNARNTKEPGIGWMSAFHKIFARAFFQWFYTGGASCGFAQFPTFGLLAWKKTCDSIN